MLDARYGDVAPERPHPAAAARELPATGHRVVGMRARAPAPGTPVAPEVAARLSPALGEAARLVLGTHRIGGRDARDRISGPGCRSPRPSVGTVACLEHLNHVLATGRNNP